MPKSLPTPPSLGKPRRRRSTTGLPYPDFPLSYNPALGQFYKTVKGHRFYFGSDWQKAIAEWERCRDHLMRGLPRPAKEDDGLTVADACNRFLTAKTQAVEAGELRLKTFRDLHRTCGIVCGAFGKTRQVSGLGPDDFGRLRAELAKTNGPVALTNVVGRVRQIFKHAADNRLIPAPVFFGTAFRRPRKADLRRAKAARPAKTFTAAEVRTLLDAASPMLRAAILLGVNCGLGNSDIAELEPRHLAGEWLSNVRPKTGQPRKAWLWPETREALDAWAKVRPAPPPDAPPRVFLTRNGEPTTRTQEPGARSEGVGVNVDPLAQAFRRLLKRAGLLRDGRAFYGLRHTYREIADALPDRPAIDLTMGHVAGDGDMRQHYVDRIADARLRAVAQHVAAWLWPKSEAPAAGRPLTADPGR